MKRVRLFGLVAIAGMFAVLCLCIFRDPYAADLSVSIIDTVNGKPVSAWIEVQEFWPYPILNSLRFLPERFRQQRRVRREEMRDGVVRVRRISKTSEKRSCYVSMEGRGVLDYLFAYHAPTNGEGLILVPLSGEVVRVAPGQKEVRISIPVNQQRLPPL
jgi:hypothetical protein